MQIFAYNQSIHTSSCYRSHTLQERNEWIRQTNFVLCGDIMEYLGL